MNLVPLHNLRKRLREKLKTSAVDRDILDLIREIEDATDKVLADLKNGR